MIDFTNMPTRKKAYAGANGNKISIVYNGDLYMLKFPGTAKLNDAISYANGCISEYLGCHIFESVGIPAQETLLGTYTWKGRERIVVACKDFTTSDLTLQDFMSLKNAVLDTGSNGSGTDLSSVLETINSQSDVDPDQLRQHFWDMFIVDALIGNWDRHNGNWGFLYNRTTDALTIAPVFDCGSSLYPQADETIMKSVLDNPAELNARIFSRPISALKQDGKKINYFDFISSLQNEDCNAALKRIVPRINMKKICELVDTTPFITDLQKDFYKTMLTERKNKILDKSLQQLVQRENAVFQTQPHSFSDRIKAAEKAADQRNADRPAAAKNDLEQDR